MAFRKEIHEGGVEITFRVTEQEYEILKYASKNGYSNLGHDVISGTYDANPVGIIRKLLYWEMTTLQMHSGEVEKYRWKLLLAGKDPDVDLRGSNPELFVKSGGIIREKKIPQFKPRFPALLTYDKPLLN